MFGDVRELGDNQRGVTLRVPGGVHADSELFRKRQQLGRFDPKAAFSLLVDDCLNLIEATSAERQLIRGQVTLLIQSRDRYYRALDAALETPAPCDREALLKQEADVRKQLAICAGSMSNKLQQWSSTQQDLREDERRGLERIQQNFAYCVQLFPNEAEPQRQEAKSSRRVQAEGADSFASFAATRPAA